MQLKRLQEIMNRKKLDLILLFSKDINFKYFNGFNDFNGIIAVSRKDFFVITNRLEARTARIKSRIRKIFLVKKDINSVIKGGTRNIRVIGINKDDVTLNQYKRLRKEFRNARFTDVSKELSNIRSVKTGGEINKIKMACRTCDSIFFKLERVLSKNKTGIEIADLIREEIRKKNCTEAFPAIVASGKNSADIHHLPTNNKLKGFTIIDLGVKYDGYCSDMTRTFYVGKPSKKEINEYSKILWIMEGIKKPSDIRSAKLMKNQHHALGHSVGIEVHEKPTLSRETNLNDGMVIAIEPGMYGRNYGIRIEDMFLAKNNKLINLTKYTKNLIIIQGAV